jgi:hypothetical protein
MLGSKWLLNGASLRAAAFTTIFAVTAASAAQAAVIARPAGFLPAQAAAVTFTKIDNPGDPTFNQLLGINNAGVISGYFGSGALGHPNSAYTIAPPYLQFAAANVPGSTQTQATGINDNGIVTGFWSQTNTGTDANLGFIRWTNNGQYQFLLVNNPLVTSTPRVNQLLGVNQNNIAVGFYNDAAGASHGYTFNANTRHFAPVNVMGAVSDAATGINKHNLVCGFFTKPNRKTDGFLQSLSTGSTIAFHVPNFTNTQFLGVNASGIAVGFYIGADMFPHGVVYNANNGAWVTVNDPYGAMGTTLNGINDKNQIVGFYVDAANNTHGVLINGIK